MENLLEYLAQKHKSLGDSYTAIDGKKTERCFDVARQVEKILSGEGKRPQIHYVRNLTSDNKSFLVPRAYSGKVNNWKVHVVCTADNFVFDPMIGKPVLIDQYCDVAFEGKTEILPYRFN